MSPRIKLATTTLAVSFLINAYFIFANYYAVSENGTNTHMWLSGLLVLPAIACLLIAPLCLVIAVFKKYRAQSINGFIISAIFFASAFVCIRVGGLVRDHAFHQLAERSQPLVSALEAYQAQEGSLPPSLEALVPKYLADVPNTQMGAYPEYEYYVGQEAMQYDSNPWVLVIQTPSGGINWDMFMYFPLQNYPQSGYGGSLELIGKWAYVHE